MAADKQIPTTEKLHRWLVVRRSASTLVQITVPRYVMFGGQVGTTRPWFAIGVTLTKGSVTITCCAKVTLPSIHAEQHESTFDCFSPTSLARCRVDAVN